MTELPKDRSKDDFNRYSRIGYFNWNKMQGRRKGDGGTLGRGIISEEAKEEGQKDERKQFSFVAFGCKCIVSGLIG